MRIISERTIREFWKKNPRSEQTLRAWCREARSADWATPTDVRARYPKASIVADNRVMFKMTRNRYRLVVWINYERRTVYIKWLGTRDDYNDIDVTTVGL